VLPVVCRERYAGVAVAPVAVRDLLQVLLVGAIPRRRYNTTEELPLVDDHHVRAERPELAWWVSAVMGGVLFGVVMGAFTRLDGSSWTEAGVGALVTGVPFGLVTGWWSARW